MMNLARLPALTIAIGLRFFYEIPCCLGLNNIILRMLFYNLMCFGHNRQIRAIILLSENYQDI